MWFASRPAILRDSAPDNPAGDRAGGYADDLSHPDCAGTTDPSGVVVALDATANAHGRLGGDISTGDGLAYDVARNEVIAWERTLDKGDRGRRHPPSALRTR